jgi:septum site-determining protein MinD
MPARVIGIISGKGGAGKTIVSINLAAALQKFYNKKVLLIDSNPTTSHIGLYLGMYSTPTTLNDALRKNMPLKNAIYEHTSGIHVVPTSLKVDDLKNVNFDSLQKKLKQLANEYDYIILDSAPGFGKEALITLKTADEVLMVTNPLAHTVTDALRAGEMAKKFNLNTLGVAVNMVRNKGYELKKSEIESIVGIPVYAMIPFDNAVMESVNKKQPAVHINSRVTEDFRRLAGIINGENIPVRESRGFFARLFGR